MAETASQKLRILYDRNLLLGDKLFRRLGRARAIDGRNIRREDLANCDLLFVRSTCRIDGALLEGTPVRFVGSGVAGTDHLDFEALSRLGITVATAPGCNAESVADYVVAALLTFAERQQISWEKRTLGIVGVGHVGTIVKRFAEEALGMQTLCCDPPRKDAGDWQARDFVSYEELLRQADVITFHTPLTHEGPYKTCGLFSGPVVRQVKPGALLLNFARGPICDNALLTAMLTTGQLSEAAIDCWEGEPDYQPGLAMLASLTTPHIAGHAFEGKANGTWAVYKAACEFLERPVGRLPVYPDAPVSSLRLNCEDFSDQAILREAVKATCDIEADSARFRAAYSDTPAGRREAFDFQRKNYPLRRLFNATTLILSHPSASLVRKLEVLGFNVVVPPSEA